MSLSLSYLCCPAYIFRSKQGWNWTCGYLGEAGTGNPGVKFALWNGMDGVWYQNFNNRFIFILQWLLLLISVFPNDSLSSLDTLWSQGALEDAQKGEPQVWAPALNWFRGTESRDFLGTQIYVRWSSVWIILISLSSKHNSNTIYLYFRYKNIC